MTNEKKHTCQTEWCRIRKKDDNDRDRSEISTYYNLKRPCEEKTTYKFTNRQFLTED